MKNIKYLLIGFYLVSSTCYVSITALLLMFGHDKYFILNEIDFTGALVYFGVAIVAFILAVFSLTTLLSVMNFKRDQEIAHLG